MENVAVSSVSLSRVSALPSPAPPAVQPPPSPATSGFSRALSRLLGLMAVLGLFHPDPVRAQQPARAPASNNPLPTTIGTEMPNWSREAPWYFVDLPRFRNGDPSNDPKEPGPIPSPWPAHADRSAALDEKLASYHGGGDLKGLMAELPRLKELGVGTICLSSIFAASDPAGYAILDLRHVDDRLGVAGSLEKVGEEKMDPKTWSKSASDMLFFEAIAKAHALGIHVVVDLVAHCVSPDHIAVKESSKKGGSSVSAEWFDPEEPSSGAPFGQFQSKAVAFRPTARGFHPVLNDLILNSIHRWLDPNGDGKTDDGVDGFRVVHAEAIPTPLLQAMRTRCHSINHDSIVVDEFLDEANSGVSSSIAHAVTSEALAKVLAEYFAGSKERSTGSLASVMNFLATQARPDMKVGAIQLLDGPRSGRFASLLLAAAKGGSTSENTLSKQPELLNGLRLATAVHFFYPNVPALGQGHEFGLLGGPGERSRQPWPTAAEIKEGEKLGLVPLIQQLGEIRIAHPALCRGGFRILLADNERRILVFLREAEEAGIKGSVAVAINASGSVQTVELALGKPGEVVGVLRPQLSPDAPMPAPPGAKTGDTATAGASAKPGEGETLQSTASGLPIYGHRCLVDDRGKVRFSLEPNSIKLLLVGYPENR